jgi:hypothetical protein
MSNHTPGPWKIWNVAAPFQWMQWTDKMRAALAAHKAQQQEPMTWEQAVRHCITDKATQDRILSIPMDATAEEAIAILQAQQQEPSDAKDAARYRWLRDAHPATERVIAVQWNDLTQNMRHETLDAAIDAAMEAKK